LRTVKYVVQTAIFIRWRSIYIQFIVTAFGAPGRLGLFLGLSIAGGNMLPILLPAD